MNFENKTPEELTKLGDKLSTLVVKLLSNDKRIYDIKIKNNLVLVAGIGNVEQKVIQLYFTDEYDVNVKSEFRKKIKRFLGFDPYSFACPIELVYFRMYWERF